MKQRFPLLGNTSAIILMYITVATTVNSSALAYPSHNADNKDDGLKLSDNSFQIRVRVGESQDGGLMQRIFNFKRDKPLKENEESLKSDNNIFLSKYRHWYNKPRRKDVTTNSAVSDSTTQENENSIDGQSQYANNARSPLSSFRNDVLHKTSTSIEVRSRFRRYAGNQPHPNKSLGSSHNTDPTFPFAIVSPDGTQAQTWDNSDQVMLSGNVEDIANRWSRRGDKFLMYHRSSSMTVQILPDGTVNGVIERNKYCVMIMISVGIVSGNGGEGGNTNVILKILGYESEKYLALKENGQMYTTNSQANPDTDFLHIYKPSVGDFYQSKKHGLYLSFRTNGRPQKSQKVMSKRAQFLVWNASAELKEITPKPTTSTTEQKASGSSSLPKKHSNANENSETTVSLNEQNTPASTKISDLNTVLESTNPPAEMITTVAKKKKPSSSAAATKRRKPRKKPCKKGRKKDKGKRKKGKKCHRRRKSKGEKGSQKRRGGKRGGKNRKRKGKASKRTERSIQLFIENLSLRFKTEELSGKKDGDVRGIKFDGPELAGEGQQKENLFSTGTGGAALSTAYARDVT